MRNVLKRVNHGVRELALIPLMIIAGLVLYLHDRISRLLKNVRMGSWRRCRTDNGGRSAMRGEAERQATLMLGLTPEGFDPKGHSLRRTKPLADSALGRMPPLFDELYASGGRPSIPPEHLLKSSLLMAFYTVRSERQFCEQLRYNLLFEWFLDLNDEDEPFHPTTFTKNRERLLEADAARVLLKEVVKEARRRRLLSPDHCTIDGALLEARASHKSYRPRDEGPPQGGGRYRPRDFKGERRRRETHVSSTDPEARLYRQGPQQEAKLCYLGHLLTENRNGLLVDVELTQADPWPSKGQAAMPNVRRPWRCSNAASGDGPRSGPTAPATRATSSGTCTARGSPRTSPRTNRAGAGRSTDA